MRAALWVMVAALAGGVAPWAQDAADADSREVAAYRLTMEVVNKVAAATRAIVVELKKDPRFQESAQVASEIKVLEAREETTEAEDARLDAMRARKEALDEALKGPSFANAGTLSEMEEQIRTVAPLMAGLRTAGLTPRDYAKFMLASIPAGMVAGLKKQGLVTEVPKGVSAENVAFMEAHEAELRALQKELAALGGE